MARRGFPLLSSLLLAVCVSFGPASAEAEELDAVAAAERAAATHEAWCSDVAVARSTRSFEASAEVSKVLAEVSRTYDRSPEVWLLYWRGLLAACAEREERAIEDLAAFVASAEDDRSLTDQVNDAKRRLRRLSSGGLPPAARPPIPGITLGVGLAAGGGALAALSGWQAGEVQRLQTAFDDAELPWAERVANYAEPGEQAATASNALLAGAVGLGVGGAVSVVVALVSAGRGPSVAVVPRGVDGAVVVLGATW